MSDDTRSGDAMLAHIQRETRLLRLVVLLDLASAEVEGLGAIDPRVAMPQTDMTPRTLAGIEDQLCRLGLRVTEWLAQEQGR
jgi:hypothetical protein